MALGRREFLVHTGVATVGLATLGTGVGGAAAQPRRIVSAAHRTVARTLPGIAHVDGAGVSLLKIIGQPALRNLDPFVMLDRFHSSNPRDYLAGFPNHPHRGFETVTIMLEGQVRHRDSRGNAGLIVGGGAQWMTAGRGIIHSEMPEVAPTGPLLSGFQLWVNLPAREKMCPQYYQDLAPARLATAQLSRDGTAVRVIAGNVGGLVGPTRPRPTEPILLTLLLADDTPFETRVPERHAAFVFVHEGEVDIGDENRSTRVTAPALAVLTEGARVRLRARTRRSSVLFAAGRPLREPIVQRGPFVMNSDAEIERAFADYRAGTLDRS